MPTTKLPFLFCLALLLTATVHAEEKRTSQPQPAPAKSTGVKLPTGKLVESADSGAWSNAKTWNGGAVPTVGDRVLIREGHQVVYDVASEKIVRSIHVSGTLSFAPDKDTLLNVGLIRVQPGNQVVEEGFDCDHRPDEKNLAKQVAAKDAAQPGFSAICLCCQSKAALLVGTPDQPIEAAHQATIRLHFVDGMNAESCPAIVVCGGRMDLHGAPLSRTWVKLGYTTNRRDDADPPHVVKLAEPVTGWRVGDRVIVTAGGAAYAKSTTEEAEIKSIDGTTITLAGPLTKSHSGEGDYRAEVANLSRNVVVESAEPDGVRGHTMYHAGSAGSISYAEFRHLGKEGVLGRYNLHYHLCGDSLRGSSVVGASFHHSRNRWLTIHGTNYLVVRDCVGYQSLGHGYFLEDGTEVSNVFDRNLACQAVEAKPLPKQVLPYDKNDGAGFWFANCLNTFTRNVAAECSQYGFRFDASPKNGAYVDGQAYGSPKEPFSLTLPVRQPNGQRTPVDIRTLPFVRFEDNESHNHVKWGLNLGQHSGGQIGPDAETPFVIRNMKIWQVVGGWGVEMPNVLIDGMTIHDTAYGVRESVYVAQDYRNVRLSKIRGHIMVSNLSEYLAAGTSNEGHNRTRLPGWPAGRGDGGPKFQSADIEVAKLTPVDKLPPSTVITSLRRDGSQLIVRGVTSDDGPVKSVTVNQTAARPFGDSGSFSTWEAVLTGIEPGVIELTATATDAAGNRELTPHVNQYVVR